MRAPETGFIFLICWLVRVRVQRAWSGSVWASERGHWRKTGVLLTEKSAASPQKNKNASLGFVSTGQGGCMCDCESKHRRWEKASYYGRPSHSVLQYLWCPLSFTWGGAKPFDNLLKYVILTSPLMRFVTLMSRSERDHLMERAVLAHDDFVPLFWPISDWICYFIGRVVILALCTAPAIWLLVHHSMIQHFGVWWFDFLPSCPHQQFCTSTLCDK